MPKLAAQKFGKSNADLARDFLKRIHAQDTTVCPVYADSTYGETEDVARCLAPMKVSSVLIVTSDYHTRRAFSIFKARLPHYHWSIADAFAPYEDGRPQRMPSDQVVEESPLGENHSGGMGKAHLVGTG